MPIIVNGTTFNNGGKATFNGTNLTEIKFGSTTVWKAETDITSQFSTSDYYHPNGAYQARTKSGDNIVLNATSSLLRNIWTPAIDLSNYNTLSITLSISTAKGDAGYNPTRWFYILANSSNTFSGIFGTRSDGLATPGSTNTTYSKIYGNPRDSEVNTGSRTINVDISSWTGTHKLALVCACGSHNTFSITVSKVVLT